jgi:diaminopimelate decarboxylase
VATETEPEQTVSHAYPIGSRVNERGHLEIGGCDTIELAETYGTPAYIVAEDDLRTRARAYVQGLTHQHEDSDVLFASKAFPCTAVYRVLADEGLACDVASGGELALALKGGFDPRRIYLHGNAKSETEIREAMQAGVGHIVLDSLHEFDVVERQAAALNITQAVLIRVTPDVKGDTHAAISTGQANSKFGFGMDEARIAIERTDATPHLRLVGLHCHIGSQLLTLEPFQRAVQALATLGEFGTYNLGGGLGVAYTNAQEPPSIASFLKTLTDAAHTHLGPGKRLLIEPGRSLVANSTVTLYTVQTVKRNVSTWVAVDGGMSDNLRPMLYGSQYEVAIASRPTAIPTETCVLAGKHCESGDVIAKQVGINDPQPGDIVVTPATGAYGYAMANNYNGVPRPPVIFCKDGEARVVVRRETYEDLSARDV